MLLRLAMHVLFHKNFYVYFLLSLISSCSQDSDLLKKAFCCSIELPLLFYPGEQCRHMLIDKLKCMSDQAYSMKFIVYKKEKNFIDRYDVIFLAFVINSANLRAVVM